MSEKIKLACPRCHATLLNVDKTKIRCPNDGLSFRQVDGIWRMLLPEREKHFASFIHDYETIRLAEGRGSSDKAYYRKLPSYDLSGRMSGDWRIRAASFDEFIKHVMVPFEKQLARSLIILDLGSGNCWLSNRLAIRDHEVAAIDLTINDFDGLGCHRFYDSTIIPIQADFDNLPFPDSSVDMALFNASLHYSVNINETVGEALRTLQPSGLLVILDSPIYHDPTSGEQMVREREATFTRQYGFPSNELQSTNYLTYAKLKELAKDLDLNWKFHTPLYSLQWTLRPILAFLLSRREPAKFHVIVGRQ
jgi:ubiquinone/menaquinone biosynthesis C-methylase UbiE/uncharacterized protein YbaR (Trm112 family)